MGKVKKAGAVRKSKAKKSPPAKKRRSGVTKVALKTTAKTPKGRRKAAPPTPAVSTFHVRELDPLQKCGAGTSVQRLFRIDETNAGAVRPHLVFFDRHGLYCEHGRDCPAVPYARSVMAHDNPQHNGPTHNGRMRA